MKKEASVLEVLLCFLRLGVTSFGGPVAHLSYFHAECVERRRWLDEASYADLVALCQFLPGPASSQVGIALGYFRAGWFGGLAAWLGFTLPSALALVAFAYGVELMGDLTHAPWLHGLKIVAVAVVAQAVWGMAQSLCPDRARASVAVAAAVLILAVPSTAGQIGVLAAGGLIGWACLSAAADARGTGAPSHMPAPSPAAGLAALAAFAILLFGLPLVASQNPVLDLLNVFYRAGSLVFGGGHVVLPLLRQAVVPRGWISEDAFLAGYGAAQAVPGPLFTFAAYLGAAMRPISNGWLNGWLGAIVALIGIYLPSFLLLIAALPFWGALRQRAAVRSALKGVNAAVVGLLLAALYTPVWTSAIFTPGDFSLALAAFLLLTLWKTPPWLVVVLCPLAATALARV